MDVENSTIIGIIMGIPIAIVAITVTVFYIPTLPRLLQIPFLLYLALATGLVQCYCCSIAYNLLIRSNSKRDD